MLPRAVVWRAQEGVRLFHAATRRNSSWQLRLYAMLAAVEALPEEATPRYFREWITEVCMTRGVTLEYPLGLMD